MAARIRKQLKSVMGRFAGLTGAYERRFRSQMTIVAFHRVNDQLPGDSLTCSPAKFEATGKGESGPTAGAVYELAGWAFPDASGQLQ